MSSAGSRLRELRKGRKLTQPQVAEAAGVPQSTLSEIEREESKNPSAPVLLKLAAFFEVEPHWIVTGEGPRYTVTSKDDRETELLLYYRTLSPEGRDYLLSRARDMHLDESKSKPKPADDGKSKFQ